MPYSYTSYIKNNGSNGTNEGTFECAIGGNTVLNKRLSDGSMFMSGIGRDTGLGGDQHSILTNDTWMNCDHTSKGNDGRGGALYILSTEYYSVCKIDAPNNATITVNVTGDNAPVDESDAATRVGNNIQVGTIQTTGDLSFIVRKGAKVNYTVSQQYYNTESGYFIAGQANGASVSSNVTVNNLNTSDNTQTVKVNLSKTIYKHTITSSEATIIATGKFTDTKGNLQPNSQITGNGKVEFYVWADENNNDVNYTVSKQYYNTKSGSVNVTLDKTIYYSNVQNYTIVDPTTKWYQGKAKWNETGNLRDSRAELRLYTSDESGTITLTFNGATNNISNWKLRIIGYEVGIDPKKSSMTIVVRDNNNNIIKNETKGFAKKDVGYDLDYDFTNRSIRTVTITFNTSSGTDKRFWLSQVYVQTNT